MPSLFAVEIFTILSAAFPYCCRISSFVLFSDCSILYSSHLTDFATSPVLPEVLYWSSTFRHSVRAFLGDGAVGSSLPRFARLGVESSVVGSKGFVAASVGRKWDPCAEEGRENGREAGGVGTMLYNQIIQRWWTVIRCPMVFTLSDISLNPYCQRITWDRTESSFFMTSTLSTHLTVQLSIIFVSPSEFVDIVDRFYY